MLLCCCVDGLERQSAAFYFTVGRVTSPAHGPRRVRGGQQLSQKQNRTEVAETRKRGGGAIHNNALWQWMHAMLRCTVLHKISTSGLCSPPCTVPAQFGELACVRGLRMGLELRGNAMHTVSMQCTFVIGLCKVPPPLCPRLQVRRTDSGPNFLSGLIYESKGGQLIDAANLDPLIPLPRVSTPPQDGEPTSGLALCFRDC